MRSTDRSRDWMVKAKCRGTINYDAYESDNRGGGQVRSADIACGGCRARVECARYALALNTPKGMVWAGIPVPDTTTSGGYKEAIRALKITASLPAEGER